MGIISMPATSRAATELGLLIDRGLKSAAVRSLNDLAERCGIAKSYLSYLRTGKAKRPSDAVVQRLADTLGQDVADYQLALLADRGELPHWGSVLSHEIGIPLNASEERAIEQFVEEMLKHRRGT